MKAKLILLGLLIIGSAACVDQEIQAPVNLKSANVAIQQEVTSVLLDALNAQLELQSADFRIAMVELLTTPNSNENGATIYSKIVGNKMLGADFVPGDPGREWSADGGNSITYAIDQKDAVPLSGGLSAIQTTDAIVRGFDTWDAADCSEMGLTRNFPASDLDLGYYAYLLYNEGLPDHPELWQGSDIIAADIQHVGWGDLNFAGGTLAATITFIWVDENGPTDINGDGLMDVAFRETYYDNDWTWKLKDNLDPDLDIELETVAVHEIGHGLSQAHFGTILILQNGKVKAAPRAIMNQMYLGVLTELQGTDIGGHCGIWDNWPYE